MMRRMMAVGLVVVAAAAAGGFEVASVKVATPGPWRESNAGVDRIDFSSVTLRYCLAFAYEVKEYQVSGPAWIGQARYDIVAKGAEGTRREQLPGMMQSLLEQRFRLQAHTEMKEFSVYALVAGKNGPKLKESAPDAEGAGAKFGISMSPAGVGRFAVKGATMTALAAALVRLLGRPVIDFTELGGRYDLDLEYSPDDANGMTLPVAGAEPGVSIFGSIQQFGLRLEGRKVPMKAVTVDSADKTPTEN